MVSYAVPEWAPHPKVICPVPTCGRTSIAPTHMVKLDGFEPFDDVPHLVRCFDCGTLLETRGCSSEESPQGRGHSWGVAKEPPVTVGEESARSALDASHAEIPAAIAASPGVAPTCGADCDLTANEHRSLADEQQATMDAFHAALMSDPREAAGVLADRMRKGVAKRAARDKERENRVRAKLGRLLPDAAEALGENGDDQARIAFEDNADALAAHKLLREGLIPGLAVIGQVANTSRGTAPAQWVITLQLDRVALFAAAPEQAPGEVFPFAPPQDAGPPCALCECAKGKHRLSAAGWGACDAPCPKGCEKYAPPRDVCNCPGAPHAPTCSA